MSERAATQDYSIVPETAKKPVWFNGKLVDWHESTLHDRLPYGALV